MRSRYRFWNFEKGEMGSVTHLNKDGGYLLYEGPKGERRATLNQGVLMASSGHKDKNGVELYEGDIVKIEELSKRIFATPEYIRYRVIKIIDNSWVIVGNYSQINLDEQPMIFVVGNIHQHPHLIPKDLNF